MKYLVRKVGKGLSKAHLWIDGDTACKMASTGGLDISRYDVLDKRGSHDVCAMCQLAVTAEELAGSDGAASARQLIERAWKYNERRANLLGYELMILAIPRHPADIEAIASTDIDTLCDVLETYVQARRAQVAEVKHLNFEYGKQENINEIRALQSPSGSPSEAPREGNQGPPDAETVGKEQHDSPRPAEDMGHKERE